MATIGGNVLSIDPKWLKIPVDTKVTKAVSEITKLLRDLLLEDLPSADELALWLEALESLIPKKLRGGRGEFMARWYWVVYPNYVILKSREPIPVGHRATLR